MMIVDGANVSCPICGWEPSEGDIWVCDLCRTRWNTFETHGKCPGCGKQFIDTQCSRSRGGCGQMSLNAEWYQRVEATTPKVKEKFTWFWQNKTDLPVTQTDKEWVENGLQLLADMLGDEYLRSLPTITPDKKYFDRQFSGTEADAEFIFKRVAELMDIDPWEITLMFYSEKPQAYSPGITETPSAKLKGPWKGSAGQYVDKGPGQKEIWLELETLNDAVGIIATLSHELAHYKLLGEHRMETNDEHLTDLTSIAFGFGIFRANSYFKFSQWQGHRHHGWQMQKKGYLPEQMIAYAMAWLAHCRNEDISWKHYLTKTVRKYFERSYKYIDENRDS